jgi:hypothetical protein
LGHLQANITGKPVLDWRVGEWLANRFSRKVLYTGVPTLAIDLSLGGLPTSRRVAVTDETRMEVPSSFPMMYTCVASRDAVSTPMRRTATIGHFTKLRAGSIQPLQMDFGEFAIL